MNRFSFRRPARIKMGAAFLLVGATFFAHAASSDPAISRPTHGPTKKMLDSALTSETRRKLQDAMNAVDPTTKQSSSPATSK